MTVGDLKELLKTVDNELNIYALLGVENPLDSGRSIDRVIVITSDTDGCGEGVYFKSDL